MSNERDKKKSEEKAKKENIYEQDDQEDELGGEYSENLISGKRLDD